MSTHEVIGGHVFDKQACKDCGGSGGAWDFAPPIYRKCRCCFGEGFTRTLVGSSSTAPEDAPSKDGE